MSRLPLLILLPLLLAAAPRRAKLPYEFLPDAVPARPADAEGAAAAPAATPNPFVHDETKAEAEARAQAMFERMDLDHDGAVTLAEMSAFAAARAPRPAGKMRVARVPALVKAMFDDADADHDGRISPDESKAAADRGFDETDTNHDGVVSPAERMAAMQDVTDNKVAPKKAADMVGR